MLIERGQADAIRLVRSTVNPAPGTTTASEPMEVNATNTSGVPPMVAPRTATASEQLEANATNTSGVTPMVFVDDEG